MSAKAARWHFSIDRYVNPLLPRPHLDRLPRIVSRFLGYRSHPRLPLGNLIVVTWAFIGVFCGVSIIEIVGQHVPSFAEHGAPIILGQALSSVIGVAITKLFFLSPHFDKLRWLAGALACASATLVMALTGTVHPPAGATALLAAVDDAALQLGWFLVPVVMLGCTLMLATALLLNNIQRQFPVYWWTPEEVGQWWLKDDKKREHASQEKTKPETGSDTEACIDLAENPRLIITSTSVIIPDNMDLRPEEMFLLESLSRRL